MSTRRDLVVDVLVEHAYDHNEGECICGAAGSGWELAEHVADQVLEALEDDDA